MNCKNVEPLLSLYVGRDLNEEYSRLVAAHLQSCVRCTHAADEYARAGQLLQGYKPPFFSDEIYAGIREQVLNEIERESHAPVWPSVLSQLFSALVQPRMRWITAALLLVISVTALYLSRKPSGQLPDAPQLVRLGEPNQAGSGAEVRSENRNESAGSSLFSNKGKVRIAPRHRPITHKREANAGVVATNRSWEFDKTTKVNLPPSSGPAPLRVEMQTNDRNIRIIWLSGPRPAPGVKDGSKGI